MKTTGASINRKEKTITFQFSETDFNYLVAMGLKPVMDVSVHPIPDSEEMRKLQETRQKEWDDACAKEGHEMYTYPDDRSLWQCRNCGRIYDKNGVEQVGLRRK